MQKRYLTSYIFHLLIPSRDEYQDQLCYYYFHVIVKKMFQNNIYSLDCFVGYVLSPQFTE